MSTIVKKVAISFFMCLLRVLVMVHCGWRRSWFHIAFQEFFFFLLLLNFIGRFRIEVLHLGLFSIRDLRQMPNEGDELPTVHIVIARIAERWHSAQADSVFDGVVEFSVGKLLRVLLPHVWRARIHRLAVHGVTAAIVGMAGGAVVRPMCHSLVDHFLSGRNRVLPRLVT